MDSLLDPHKLIPTTELIRLAMSEGLYVGSGDPANYVRYLTKVGLLPPARRLGFNGGNYTVGHYPKSSLDSLRQISGLVKAGWTIQQIVDQGTPTDIPTTDLISRARLQGIYLGSGDPVNYIRYLTKLGILPNAQRQAVNGSANTVGHYPVSALETLKDVERRLRSGETIQQIAQAEGAASWFTQDLAQPEPIKPALITHPVSNKVGTIDNRQIVVADNKLSKRTWLPSKPILLASAGVLSMGVFIMSIPIFLSGRGAGELSQQVLTTLNLIPATGSTTLDAQTSYKQEADQNFRLKNVEDTTKVVALATQDLTTQNQSVKEIALEARATANAGITSLDSSTQNEIQNSSFELNNSGQPDAWQYISLSDSTNTFVSQDCSRTGQNAVKFVLTGVNAGGIKQSQTLTRSEIDPALSAWVKGNGLSSNGYIRIGLKDASGKFVSKQDYFLSGTFDWQRLTLSASALGAYPAVEFKGYTKGTACIDDWQVTEGSVQVRYNQTNLLAQGTISASGHAELAPIVDGKGSLGTPLNRFGALYLTAAAIDKNGNATIGGTITSHDIQPSKDLTYNIGTPTLRYKTIFADSVVTSGSGGGSGDFTVGGNLTVTGTSHLIGNVTIDNNLFAPPAGTVGYWSRSGTTLSPSNTGDNVSTTGSITGATLTTTGNASIGGAETVTGLLTANGGIVTNNAAINSGSGSISGGSITGATLTTTGNTSVGGNLNLTGATSSIVVTTAATPLNIDAGTSGAVNIAGISTGDVNLAGGSGSTGCTVTNSNGNFSCSGNILGNSSGTVGYWSRSGTTLSPATSGDNVTTSGNISTTGTGVITSAGLLTASNGLTQTTGALNLTATSGVLSLSGLGASSISTGANALTVTSSNFNTTATGINSTAIGATTTSTGAFTTLAASSTVTFSGLSANSGTSLCLNGTTVVTCTAGSAAATLQSAYNQGNTITTTDARNITLTFADTATDQSLTLTQQGTVAAILLNDTNAATNIALDIQSGGVSKLTINELGTLSTSGNIATTGSGTITSAGLLTASNGLTLTTGALNLTATSGALSLSGLSASSINAGANALTFSSSNFNTTATGINSTAIGATTASTGAFTTLTSLGNSTIGTGASSINTIGSTTTPGTLTLHGATTLDNTFTVSGANLTTLGGNLTFSGANPNISASTANTNLTVNANGTGTITLGSVSTGNIGFFNVANNFITSGGNLTLAGDINLTAGGTIASTANADIIINAGTGSVKIGASGNGKLTVGILDPYIVANTGTVQSALEFQTAATAGADDFIFEPAGVEKIRFTEAGNISLTGASPSISLATLNATLNLDANGTGTINIGSASTGDVLIGGGSGSTGCTVTNSNGNFICSGNITGSASGTVGYWTRTGTTLAPATAGDNVTTSGNISTTGSGTITSAGLLTASNGLTQTTGALNLTSTSGSAALTLTSSLTALNVNSGLFDIDTTNSRVGIGTTTPGEKLQIAGNVKVDSNVLFVGKSGAGLGGQVRYLTDDGVTRWFSGVSGAAGATGYSLYDIVNGQFRLWVDSSSGNVGIGTTNPSSFKLQVAGNIGPDANNTYDLGSSTLAFRSAYLTTSEIFKGTSFNTTLGFVQPTAARTVNLPDEGGTVCLQNSANCGFATAGSGTFLLKNAHDTSSALYLGNLYDFTNTNTGAAGVLSLTNSGTNSALSVTQSGNPAAGQALIFANNSNVSPFGNLLDLQAGGVSKFSVTSGGASSQAGNHTFTGASPSIATTSNADLIINAGSGAVKIGANGNGKLTVGILDPYIVANTGTVQSALEFQTAATAGADDFVFETGGTTERVRIFEGGNVNLVSGDILTASTSRLTNAGGLQNITGYTQTSGNFSAASSTGTFDTSTGLVGLNGSTTLAANKNFTIATGTGIFTQTFQNTGSNAFFLDVTNTGSSGSNTVHAARIALSGTANGTGTNTINGIFFPNISAFTNNSFYALNLGTGFTDALRVGGAQIINGTGVLQSAGFSGTYTSAVTLSNGTNSITTNNLTATGGTINSTTIGVSTPSTGSFTTLASSSTTTFSGGATITCTGCITDANVVDALTISGGTVNNTPIGATTTSTGAFTTLSASGLISANGGITLGANQNLTYTAGTGSETQTYTNTGGDAKFLNITNSASSGTSTVNTLRIALTGTANGTGSNTINALLIPNITPQTNNTFNALNFGTGLSSVLVVGGTQIVDGSGILKSAGLSGTYSNTLTLSSSSNSITAGTLTATGGTINGTTIGQSTPAAGSFTTLSASSNASLSGGATITCTGCITDANVVDALTINAGTVNNTPIGATTASTGAFTTISASGLISANGGLTVAANQNLTLTSGTGLITQTYVNTGGSALTQNITDSASSGSTTVSAQQINLTGTANGTGSNTINGFLLTNITPQTNNTFNALNFGTGLTNTLVVGGTTIINGTGVLQSSGLSGTYSNALTLSNASNSITAGTLTATGGTINGTSVGATTTSTGAFTTLSASSTTTLSGGATITCTGCITDANVVDALTISGGTINNTPIGATTPSTGAFTTLSASGLISANGGLTLAANQNLVFTSGTGTETQTYVNTASNAKTINVTNSASSGSTTVNAISVPLTGTANGTGTNTINGLFLPNITAQTNNTFNALNFGSGLTNTLIVNGTTILNGSGVLQSAGLSGTYSNALTLSSASNSITAGTLTATGGTINGTSVGATTTSTGAFTTLSASGSTTLSGGLTLTCTACITDTNVVDALTISGGTINNTPIGATTTSTGAFTTISASGQITSTLATGTAPFVVASTTNVANLNASSLNGATFAAPGPIGSTTASTGAFTTISASGLISANGGLTLAANQNLTFTSGTGTETQTYVNTTGNSKTLNVTDSASSGATTVNGVQLALIGTANGTGTNTLNALQLPNITAQTNNTFNALNFGSGLTNTLIVNGTTILNGAGVLLSAGLSGTYSNALTLSSASNSITAGTLTATGGTINGTSIGATTRSTGAFTTLAANSTVTFSGLGAAGTTSLCLNGTNVETCSTGSSTATLQSAYNAGNTITTTDARNIAITLADTTTDQSLTLTQQGAATALILNDTNGGTNNAVDVQSGGVSKLTINELGTLSTSGNITTTGTGTGTFAGLLTASNGLTLTSGALNLTASSGAINVTGLGASTISTTSSGLTLSTVTSGTLAITSAGALNLTAGAASTVTLASSATALNFQSGLLNLDTLNSRIGIGTASPSQRLEVYNGNLLHNITTAQFTPLAAPGAPTVAIGAAGVLSGTYNYQITFITASGETEGGTVSSNVTVSSQQIALSAIPTGTSGVVTARKIYRTTAGPTTPRKLVTTLNDNTTTTYNDNIADGSLTTTIPSYNTTDSITATANNLVISHPSGKSVVIGDGINGATSKLTVAVLDPYLIINTGTFQGALEFRTTNTGGTDDFIFQPRGVEKARITAGGVLSVTGNITATGTVSAAGFSNTGGSISLNNGTASAPSLNFTNSAGTGLYRVGADILGLTTAGSQRAQIDASGNVSIGNTVTTGLLNVGSTGQFQVSSTGGITAPTSGTINSLNISSGALSAVTGYTQTSGNFSASGSGGTFDTSTGAVGLNGSVTVAANKNLTLTSGTGTITQTFSNTSGNAAAQTVTNTSSAAGTVSGLSIALAGSGTSATTNAIILPNVTPVAGNVFNGINLGTGLNSSLIIGGTQILNGTGVLQSAGLSGTYSNALTLSSASNSITAGTLTATGGTINGTSVGATTTSTGAFTTLSASGASTLSGGATITCTACITDTNVVDALTISGGTINNTPLGATTASTGAFTTISATGQITSTLATGTAPFSVASTTNVANLNASTLSGATFAAPGPIGSTTASTGAFTTISASGQITSTVATGSAPFVVASTTNVANLNASTLSGATFAAPGPIGSTTAGTGAFTTLSASGLISANGGLTLASNQNLTLTSGTGQITQTYSNTSGNAAAQTVTNTSSAAGTVSGLSIALAGSGTSATTNGIILPNVTPVAGNVFNGINLGTGLNSALIIGGTTILNGTGVLQSAGLSGTYSNALTLSSASNSITAGTLTATGGTINGTSVGATTTSTGAFTTLSASGTTTLFTTNFTGDIDLQNHIISNIGNAGTDFLTNGGLTLANALTVSTGGVTVTGNSTFNNSVTINTGGQQLNIKDTAGVTHGYIAYQDSAGSRKGYIGYPSNGSTQLSIRNELSGGNVLIDNTGAGTIAVTSNGALNLSAAAASTVTLANVTNAWNIDANTLVVDALNNRVGIGTNAPSEALQISAGNLLLDAGAGVDPGIGQIYLKNGNNFGVSRDNYQINLTGSLAGRLISRNPTFLDGTTGYQLYDNSGGGRLVMSSTVIANAPNSSGTALHFAYDGAGTQGTSPSPGFGGFVQPFSLCGGTNEGVNGFCYREGNRLIYKIWAKIPVGYTINHASNTYGTNGSESWLTSQAGTGDWKLYIKEQTIGIGGTFSSTGHIYLTCASCLNTTAFTWDVADFEVRSLDEPASVSEASNLNIGYYQGQNLAYGQLLSTKDAFLAVSGGNVGIGTLIPAYKLEVTSSGGGVASTSLISGGLTLDSQWSNFVRIASGLKVDTGTVKYNTANTNGVGSIRIEGGVTYFDSGTSTGSGNTASLTTNVTILANGNVGIGTTSPQAPLDVRSIANIGGIGAQGTIRVFDSASTGTGSWGIISMDPANQGRLTISSGNGSASTENTLAISSTTVPGVDNTYTLGTTSLRWGSLRVGTSDSSFAGNVGIGTTAPGVLLELGTNTGPTGYIRLRGATTAEGNIYHDTTYSLRLDTNSNATPIRIDGSALHIFSASGVGINTASIGAGLKLDVNGDTRINSGATTPAALVVGGSGTISAERSNIYSTSVTFTPSTGLTNERFNFFDQPTITSGSALTVTNASTLYIAGAPLAAGSATITNSAALIVNSGNVGIGLLNPAYPIDVAGTIRTKGGAFYATQASPVDTLIVDNLSSGSARIVTNSTVNLALGTNNSITQLVLQNGGNVGIGTANPSSAKLQVSGGDISIDAGNKIVANLTAGGNNYLFSQNIASPDLELYAGGVKKLVLGYGTGKANYFNDGNVGIGTATPQAKLDIFQSGTFNSTTPGLTRYGLHLTPQNTTLDTASGITFGAGDSGSGQTAQAGIYAQFSANYGTKLYFATTDAYGTGAKTRLMIDHLGNVGINNLSPANKLNINTPNTADSLAQELIYTNAATNKGLVVQGFSGQSANLSEWQDRLGNILANITAKGSIFNIGGHSVTALAVPAAPTVVVVGTAGTTTWAYTVTATSAIGETTASTATSVTTGNATLSGSNLNRITWTAVTGAVTYKVYRTTAGGTPASTGLIATINDPTVTFDDTGVAGSGTSPTINSSGDFLLKNSAGTVQFQAKSNGDIVVGAGGVGKITVTTFDPLYNIGGVRYSTYAPSMIGVNEEITGTVATAYDATKGVYSSVIDIGGANNGSDLWVFGKVTDPNLSLTSVLVSGGNGKSWYVKDASSRKITIYSDRGGEVSYRLTAPRFDHLDWGTLSEDQVTEGYHVPNAVLTTQPGSTVLNEDINSGAYTENYQTTDATITRGDVVSVSKSATSPSVVKSAGGYDAQLSGVAISNSAGVVSVASSGRVSVKVSVENGAIVSGDHLTSSATKPGVAMKSAQAGRTLGVSLQSTSVDGVILVSVSPSWFDPQAVVYNPNGTTSGTATSTSGTFTTLTATTGTITTANITNLNIGSTKIFADTSGNLKVDGNVIITGKTQLADLRVNGVLSLNGVIDAPNGLAIKLGASKDFTLTDASGSSKLKVTDQGDVAGKSVAVEEIKVATSSATLTPATTTTPDTYDYGSATVGSGTFKAGTTSLLLKTTKVTAGSKIFVSFSGNYAPASRYWTGKVVDGVSFTLNLDQGPVGDVDFNWWVVN